MKESNYNIKFNMNNREYTYNSLSKTFIDNKLYDYIDSDEEVKKMLYENGILVDADFNELIGLQYIYLQEYFSKEQLTIIVTPTWSCNLKCPYCMENDSDYVIKDEQYFDVLKKYSLENFKKYKHVHISLFGGEPLLLEKDLFDYLGYVDKIKGEYNFTYTTSITTNGTLINKSILQKLVKHNCKSLQITLDGNKEKHDNSRIFKYKNKKSFDLLIEKIKMCIKLLDKECEIVVRFNLNNIKAVELESTLDLFNDKEKKRILLLFRLIYNTNNYKVENKNTFYDLREFYKLALRKGYGLYHSNFNYKQCEAGGTSHMYYILPDLKVWKCISDLSIEEANIGYIDREGKLNLKASNIINWYLASDWTRDAKCNDCKMAPDCLGGCILYNIQYNKRQCRDFNMFSLPYLYK